MRLPGRHGQVTTEMTTESTPLASRSPPTGGSLVLLPSGTGRTWPRRLRNAMGVDPVLFDRLDAALVHGDADQTRALYRFAEANGLLVEPERLTRSTARGALTASARRPLRDTRSAT